MLSISDSLLYEGSLKSFQDAVNLASIVSVTDKRGDIVYANDLFCTISQYSPDELIGNNHRILNSGYHPRPFFTDMWSTISSGKPWRGEIRNKAKDGSFYWVDTVITPVFNEKNEIVQYLSVRNLITSQKENENFRSSVFASLTLGIAVLDKDGIVVSANDVWTNFCRFQDSNSFHADIGQNYLLKCVAEIENGNYYAAKARSGIEEILNKESEKFEMEFTSFGNKNLKFISLRATPMLDGGAVLTYYDITNEKKYQQEIVENKDKLLSLSSKVAKLGYWELDTETFRLTCTDELQNIMETRAIQDLDSFVELILEDDRKMVKRNITDSMNGNFHPCSYRFRAQKSGIKWLQLTPAGAQDLKERSVIYGTIQDITELKQYESELERSLSELSERYGALMQFSFIVSHNLRSPIINLLELSNILSSENIDEETYRDIAVQIQEASKKLDIVTHDLSKVLAARNTADKKRELVSVRSSIDTALAELKQEIEAVDGRINVSVSDENDSMYTIKSYLESIVYNLISNAIKYRSEERKPVVNIEISRPEEQTLQLEISDNGLGIDLKKYKNKIFNLYQRFHKDIEGQGLGLYMTKTQTEALGGKISVLSEPGAGATFVLTFQIHDNE